MTITLSSDVKHKCQAVYLKKTVLASTQKAHVIGLAYIIFCGSY